MAFFDTISLSYGPTTNSDHVPWEWKWRRGQDHGQVYGGEEWVGVGGTFLSPSTTTAGYMAWNRRESLRRDRALGYETHGHIWGFSHRRRSHFESDFDPYNDGYAEVPERSDQFTTAPWARSQMEKEGSRVPFYDIHSGRSGDLHPERLTTRHRRRTQESREHSLDQSMSDGTGYALCHGYYASSPLPIRVHGTSYGERACPWTRVHAEQNLESSEDIGSPNKGSYSDDESQISTDIEDTNDDDAGEGYGPLSGWRNSRDESNETNVLPPLNRRCESIVDGESDDDVNMAANSNRDQGLPYNPVRGPHISRQQHQRTDLGGDNSLSPTQARWQHAKSSSSESSASTSPPAAFPRSCHPKHPSVEHEHTCHQRCFQATTSPTSRLPSTPEKFKHRFRQMQRVCRALRSERRKLLHERKRLQDEKRRLENAWTGTGGRR